MRIDESQRALGKPVQEKLNGNGDQYEPENAGSYIQANVTDSLINKSGTDYDDAGYQGYGQDYGGKQHVIHFSAGFVGIKDYGAHGSWPDEDRDSQRDDNLIELHAGFGQPEVVPGALFLDMPAIIGSVAFP